MNHKDEINHILLHHTENPVNEVSDYIDEKIDDIIARSIFIGIAILIVIGIYYLCTTQS